MYFCLVSDIHLENGGEINVNSLIDIKKISNFGEHIYLILAGDICELKKMNILITFLKTITELNIFRRIFYVFGNHEYYIPQHNTVSSFDNLQRMFDKELAKNNLNITILNNDSVDIDNVRIFGGTMWSEPPKESSYYEKLPILSEEYRNINRTWAVKEHYKFRYNLEQEIIRSKNDNKLLLTVTHYAPTFNRTLKVEHYTSPFRFMYCTDLDNYINKEYIHTWMFGHTHVNTDFVLNGTRLVTNQYGFDGYDNSKIIHIKDTEI